MFYVVGCLFNFDFKFVLEGLVLVFYLDVKVWEVIDKDFGKLIGLWYLDFFVCKGKCFGVWVMIYCSYIIYDGVKIVLFFNNLNFVKGLEGELMLILWDDVEIYFYEFGYVLYFLLVIVKYLMFYFGVCDYMEFQLQLFECWLIIDEVVD